MSTVLSPWRRLPVVVRAVLVGVVVASAGTLPWAWLAAENLRHGRAVPWDAMVMAPYLWVYWRYLRGAGWPRATADARRQGLRANPLPGDAWSTAIMAGLLGLVALVFFMQVWGRLVQLPQQRDADPSTVPLFTLAVSLVMGSLVAGFVEEAAFRGYMQGPIERRHGPVVAILVTGICFGFAHFTHPEVSLRLMPFYLFIAAIYGGLAWLTNSIWPSIVVHAGSDVLGFVRLFATGRSEWQMTPTVQPLVWESGPDAAFWTSCALAVVTIALAIWAYVALAGAMRNASTGGPSLGDWRGSTGA
ncbi:MAG: CPBP family intramembrane metalloprotease [Acidobacteriota bacterium]|nr:CPBP family intramembrane metalloprotease [Acidobacteriota bacterium]